MYSYNELADQIDTIVDKEVAPSNQEGVRFALKSILEKAVRYEVADRTPTTMTVKTAPSKNIISLAEILQQGWELDNEEDHILQYTRDSGT